MKNEKYQTPINIYISSSYNDAELAQKFLSDYVKGFGITVDKQRNGDNLYVTIDGLDEDIDALVSVYTAQYDEFKKDCKAEPSGWVSPVNFEKSKEDESMKSESNIEDLRDQTISWGTMRSEDLIPKFLGVLKTYAKDKYDEYVNENPEVLDIDGLDDETLGWIVDELFDKLDEIAPEGTYFGAHPDDGADYGFWSVEQYESKKNERGSTDIETYDGFEELVGYADAEYVLEDVVDVLSKYYTYEGDGDDIVFDEDQAKDDPEFTIKIEGGDERADYYCEKIFYVHLPNKDAAEELASVLGGELNESKKSEGLSIDDYAKYDMDHYAAKAAGWTWDDENSCYVDKDGIEVEWDSSDAVMIDPIEYDGHTYEQVNVWGDGTVEFQDETGVSENWAEFDDELVGKIYAALGGKVGEAKEQESISGKNLMDPEQFEKDIREMIDGEYEDILKGCDDKERQYYEMAWQIWDDCGYDYAAELCKKLQQQMYEYVSGTDYHMDGNFANIAWDWERDHKDGIKFYDLRKKLLDGVKDADTDEFSTWAIDWFFHAFGTYNMCYNFATDLGEEAATLEQEDEEERERENSDESKKRSEKRTVQPPSYDVYTYDELSDEAKERVKDDFLETRRELDGDMFQESCVETLHDLFPKSDLDVEYSLSYCQGDGFNTYGKLDVDDVLNVDLSKYPINNYKYITPLSNKDAIKAACEKAEISEIELPRHRDHYGYSLADRLELVPSYEVELSATEEKLLNEFEKFAQDVMGKINGQFETDGYDFFYEASDEEVKDWADANDYEFTADGRID